MTSKLAISPTPKTTKVSTANSNLPPNPDRAEVEATYKAVFERTGVPESIDQWRQALTGYGNLSAHGAEYNFASLDYAVSDDSDIEENDRKLKVNLRIFIGRIFCIFQS